MNTPTNPKRTHSDRVNELVEKVKQEPTEKEMIAGLEFNDAKRFIEVKLPPKEVNEMMEGLNSIESEMVLIRLSQMSIEYKLQRLKILAKNNE